ncbi:hypothetical protein [Saccharothrix sp.]|uniref:hypothetical protein n=1 Tax=Saccharothrix sp. TaxID=1873460 RepID=UPI00281214E4|nr:hypothetical protein [Saccharothrix sp.]
MALDFEFNAGASDHGLRRRRRLVLGLPLWGVLEPQQRVALPAHEMGHFVNGDPTRGIATSPALVTPGVLADLVRPSSSPTRSSPLMESRPCGTSTQPAGLRARIVEGRPHQEPAITLSEEDSARIDTELSRWYARAGRDLVRD